jgi:hypothetical protein
MTNADAITTATAIAAQLGETERGPRATIWRTVRTLGPERAQAFVKEAQEVEAIGGLLIPDGSRIRPVGWHPVCYPPVERSWMRMPVWRSSDADDARTIPSRCARVSVFPCRSVQCWWWRMTLTSGPCSLSS